MDHRAWPLLAALFVFCIPSLSSGAPVGESRGELWVDGPLDVKPGSDPRYPDADADFRGRQVYVWDDNPTADPDSGLDSFMRVFDSSGESLVGPVQVNTYESQNQLYPRVAIATDGSFVVIWQSFEPPMPEDNFYRVIIRCQSYNEAGAPNGSEQILSSVQTLIATDAGASVAALSGGGYVAVWESAQSIDVADSSYTIQGRLMNSNCTPNGEQFQVNSLVSGVLEADPSVAGLPDGGFVASWARPEIHARRFMADATPVGNQIQVNTFMSLNARDETDVAVNNDGRILVVWTDAENATDSTEIRGRLYSPTLSPLGSDFRINTLITSAQEEPKVANYTKGGFFVIWKSDVSVGPDNDSASIQGRVVTGADAFAGSQFQVNEYGNERQVHPGMGGNSGYVAMAWFSARNEVTSLNLILGQFWTLCGIFCNGFE